jgi:hypothetical protein
MPKRHNRLPEGPIYVTDGFNRNPPPPAAIENDIGGFSGMPQEAKA